MTEQIKREQVLWGYPGAGHTLTEVFLKSGDRVLRLDFYKKLANETFEPIGSHLVKDENEINLLMSHIALMQYANGNMMEYFNPKIGKLGGDLPKRRGRQKGSKNKKKAKAA